MKTIIKSFVWLCLFELILLLVIAIVPTFIMLENYFNFAFSWIGWYETRIAIISNIGMSVFYKMLGGDGHYYVYR